MHYKKFKKMHLKFKKMPYKNIFIKKLLKFINNIKNNPFIKWNSPKKILYLNSKQIPIYFSNLYKREQNVYNDNGFVDIRTITMM